VEVNVSFRPAQPRDKNAIKKFLAKCELPFEDLTTEHLEHFIIIGPRNKLIATVEMEVCGSYGLLRSLAVDEAHRGQNLGVALTQIIEDHARAAHIDEIYLLTTTADQFFVKQGYQVVERTTAPAEIQATEEFKRICPASAVCMVKSK
jgi:amino-acid N-acetyltransferase